TGRWGLILPHRLVGKAGALNMATSATFPVLGVARAASATFLRRCLVPGAAPALVQALPCVVRTSRRLSILASKRRITGQPARLPCSARWSNGAGGRESRGSPHSPFSVSPQSYPVSACECVHTPSTSLTWYIF